MREEGWAREREQLKGSVNYTLESFVVACFY